MPLDAILLTALRRELENSLLGAKIDRISMPEKDVLILSVHSREQGSRRVLISVRPGSARISLTEQTMENPPQPPMSSPPAHRAMNFYSFKNVYVFDQNSSNILHKRKSSGFILCKIGVYIHFYSIFTILRQFLCRCSCTFFSKNYCIFSHNRV